VNPATDLSARPPRFGRWSRVILGFLSVISALALAEGFVRWRGWAPEVFPIRVSVEKSAYRRSNNPILAYELVPNYRDPDADGHESFPYVNSQGLRDIERSLNKPAGVRRVLLLGDSVVVGNGILDLNDCISRQLEIVSKDKSTEMLNFGQGGYCTKSEVELLAARGVAFQPDDVILLFVGNDYDNTNFRVQKYGALFERPEVVKQLFVRSDLFRLAAIEWNLFHFGDEVDPQQWNQQALGDDNVREGLTMLAGLAKQHNFATFVAVWPGFFDYGIGDIWIDPSNRHEPEEIARLCEEAGLKCFWLAPYFREHFKTLPAGTTPREAYTIGDTMHPSPLGAHVAALALQDILIREGMTK